MRPRKLRRLLACVAAGAVLAGTGTGWVARADTADDAFIYQLDAAHITYPDRAYAIKGGHEICKQIRAGYSTWTVTVALDQVTPNLTLPEASVVVGVSIGAFCPEFADRIGTHA